MTKKDFIALAAILRETRAVANEEADRSIGEPTVTAQCIAASGAITAIEIRLIRWLKTQNPRFDTARFQRAANL